MCVLVESLRYCCLSAFSPWLKVTLIHCFSISQSWNPHKLMHLHIHSSRSLRCISLMFPFIHNVNTQWKRGPDVKLLPLRNSDKLDLHDFNILDGKWNKQILLWTTIQHIEDFYIIEIQWLYWSPASDTQPLSYFNSFKKGKNVCGQACVRIVTPRLFTRTDTSNMLIR